MVAKKLLENWLYWLVIDSISILLFISRDLWLTACLFGVYIVIIVFGFRLWSKVLKRIMQSALEKIKSIPGRYILKHELSSSSISTIYLGVLNDVKAVIRIDLSPASKLAVDRQHEVNLLKDISHLDLAPKVLYSDTAAGILIWEYISGEQPLY